MFLPDAARNREAERVSRGGGHLPRVFRLGSAYHTDAYRKSLFSTNRLPSRLMLLRYLLLMSTCFGLGSTRNFPTAHVPDERPHSGSEGEVERR